MARQSVQKVYADFRRGWVDTGSPLQQPEGTVKDIENFDINVDGSLTRRKGLALNFTGTYPFPGHLSDEEQIDIFVWENVAKDVDRRFLVVRIGTTIIIYDISSGDLRYQNFSIVLHRYSPFSAPRKRMTGVSALGNFFFALNTYGVGYFSYNPVTDTISFSEINIQFRDLDLWEGPDDLQTGKVKYTSSLTYPWHTYNMYNSGWPPRCDVSAKQDPDDGWHGNANPLGWTKRVVGYWPPLTIPFTACKAGAGNRINEIQAYSPWYTVTDYYGNTTPPLGRNIFNLSSFTREGEVLYQVANQKGGTYDVRERHRESYRMSAGPSIIAFYAGRLWYAGIPHHTSTTSTDRPSSPFSAEGSIFFSQTLGSDLKKAGRCYQENDPTAEDINQLLATDGGYFSLKEAGDIKAMVPLGTSLFIFSDQGVWRVSGTDFNSFTPEAYSIDKITDKGMTSDKGFAVSQDTIYFMTESGLFSIASTGALGDVQYNDLSTPAIKNFFNSISRKAMAGTLVKFDKTKNILMAFLLTEDGLHDERDYERKFDTVLVYNADLGCFYKYKLLLGVFGGDMSILDAAFTPSTRLIENQEIVETTSGERVTTSTFETVFVSAGTSFVEGEDLLTLAISVGDSIVFASFLDDEEYSDLGNPTFASVQIGFDSLGDLISDKKQAPYVVSFLQGDYDESSEMGGFALKPEVAPA